VVLDDAAATACRHTFTCDRQRWVQMLYAEYCKGFGMQLAIHVHEVSYMQFLQAHLLACVVPGSPLLPGHPVQLLVCPACSSLSIGGQIPWQVVALLLQLLQRSCMHPRTLAQREAGNWCSPLMSAAYAVCDQTHSTCSASVLDGVCSSPASSTLVPPGHHVASEGCAAGSAVMHSLVCLQQSKCSVHHEL
jgi:hypothetical protein